MDTGLRKLHKTQDEVDVLVEAAKKMAVEVEDKVSKADAFAVKVGIEKEKVNAENEAAQVCQLLTLLINLTLLLDRRGEMHCDKCRSLRETSFL